MSKVALYLAGGGARGAYQAGVLKAINHMFQPKTCPFSMISGVSIGSVNAAILAEHADDFNQGIEKLEALWHNIHCQQIYNASNYALTKSIMRNISRVMIKPRNSGYLLDTTPLNLFFHDHINFDKIHENIEQGTLETLEVISNCYETQQTISFYQHHVPHFDDWTYPRHTSQRTTLRAEHILSSSALPLFFPAIPIRGRHYGDGSMGLVSPLRGPIRFHVEKILIIGTRPTPGIIQPEKLQTADIGFAHILGNMLNGLFLDNLDRDIENVNRMNDIAHLLSIWKKRHSPWRPIDLFCLRPSMDVAKLAQDKYDSMPSFLRACLSSLGAKQHSGDLLSFLLFEKEFTRELITLGYHDTLAQEAPLQSFFQ
ncbi:MAG: patatin-like phospholipase family protein [Gammaproteobacteria bacterium]|nr:patatin-like phospholipase family protein [Gammaproteobacteria bacterium]